MAVPSVKIMNVYDQTPSSLRVKWEDVEAATGYMLLYRPVTEPLLAKEVEALTPTPSSLLTKKHRKCRVERVKSPFTQYRHLCAQHFHPAPPRCLTASRWNMRNGFLDRKWTWDQNGPHRPAGNGKH